MARSGALAVLALALAWIAWPSEPATSRPTWPRARILDAIRFVESGGHPTPPDGDDGRAIGPYQIHEPYWRDAIGFEPSIGGRYEDCRRREHAERIVDAYMRRWVPAAWAAGDAEVIARTHNGGPNGAERASTAAYWARVRARLP